jgi:hypothetical protein
MGVLSMRRRSAGVRRPAVAGVPVGPGPRDYGLSIPRYKQRPSRRKLVHCHQQLQTDFGFMALFRQSCVSEVRIISACRMG